MKKIALTLLVMLLSVSLFANGAKETAEETGKVIIYQSKVEITQGLSDAAKDFTAETGIPVEIWETSEDYRAQLPLKLAGDEVPTIFSVSAGQEADKFAPYIAGITDMKINEYISDAMSLQVNGQSSGVPYNVEGFGLVINTDLVKPEDYASEDAFFKAIDRLAAEGVNPFGLSSECYFLIGHSLNAPFALQDDPMAFVADFEAGKVHLKDVPEFQAYARLYETIREKAVNPLEINYDRSCGDFATGKTALIHQGNWAYGMFGTYDVNFDMDLVALPICDNQKLSVSVPYYWVVNSQVSEADQAASKAFIDWLYTSEKGMDYILNNFKFVPAVSNIATDSLDPLSAAVAEAAGSGETLPWVMHAWPVNIVDGDFQAIAEEFFTSDMSGIEMLDKLEAAYRARL